MLHFVACQHRLCRILIPVFGARLRAAREAAHLDQIDLAVELGFRSHQAVSHIECGRRGIDVDRLSTAARRLRVSADYLLGLTDDSTPADQRPGADGPADYVVVPWVRDVRAAAGDPIPAFDEATGFGVAFHRSVLPGWTRPDRLICIRAAGDSMEPGLRDGDLVALDHSKTEPIDGRVFVVRTEDGLVVKRLRGRPGAWTLTSDNRRYRPRPVRPADRIVGRVAWSGPPRD